MSRNERRFSVKFVDKCRLMRLWRHTIFPQNQQHQTSFQHLTVYPTIPLDKLNPTLFDIIDSCFVKRNGTRKYSNRLISQPIITLLYTLLILRTISLNLILKRCCISISTISTLSLATRSWNSHGRKTCSFIS